MDYYKFDRQIRLIGLEGQKLLNKKVVAVLGKQNLVSAEIVKNLILLGFKEVKTTPEIMKEVYKIMPDKIPNLTIYKHGLWAIFEMILKYFLLIFNIKKTEPSFFFIVDETCHFNFKKMNENNCCFVCSKCLIFNNFQCNKNHVKKQKITEEFIPKQFLLGAITIQEYLKFLLKEVPKIQFEKNQIKL